MTYQQSLDYLNSFINHEKSKSFAQAEFSLEPMRELVTLLDLDLSKLKIIHIAGTKGKGSVAHMLSASLAKSGYKVGVYSSPHIVDIRERIKIINTGEFLISHDDFAFVVAKIKKALSPTCLELSYFEVLTALAFIYFIDKNVDFLVLETGLGGRFDATNVVDPILSIITSIALEHTEILGNTYAAIAKEKAGIIKKNKTIFLGDMPDEARTAIIEVANESQSKQYVYGHDFWAEDIVLQDRVLNFNYFAANGFRKKMSCAFRSKVQAKNVALVFAVLEYLKTYYDIKDDVCEEALLGISCLGRSTQLLYKGHLLIADIAHTVESLVDLRDSLNIVEADKEKVYIFGVNRDKKFDQILEQFKSEKMIFSSSTNPRALALSELDTNQRAAFEVSTQSIEEALEEALNLIDKNACIVVTGSAYLVADLINYLNNKEVKNAE